MLQLMIKMIIFNETGDVLIVDRKSEAADLAYENCHCWCVYSSGMSQLPSNKFHGHFATPLEYVSSLIR